MATYDPNRQDKKPGRISLGRRVVLAIKETVEMFNPTVTIVPEESYWVGLGYVGGKRNYTVRRFLRARNSNGICSYFYWTEPFRGQQVLVVNSFRKRVKLTKEEAQQHYETRTLPNGLPPRNGSH